MLLSDGGPREAAHHEAEVAGVGGGGDGAGGHYEGGVRCKEPDGFEESGREAEYGADDGGGARYEGLVLAVVEVEGEARE